MLMCEPVAAASVEQAMPPVQGDGGGIFSIAAADFGNGHGMAQNARAFQPELGGLADLLDLETFLRLLQLRNDFPMTGNERRDAIGVSLALARWLKLGI